MSLLTYEQAIPWAEAIREELESERMPPWYVDPAGPAVQSVQARAFDAREVDTLITWASGGTPEGDRAKRPAAIIAQAQWSAGPPGLAIAMEAPHTLDPGVQDETRTFMLETGLLESHWVKAVDLLPGTPSMVRDATISVENGPVLGLWVPGDGVLSTPGDTAFRLPAGARLGLTIRYKKSWRDEGVPKSDRSTVGLYLTEAPPPGQELQARAFHPPAPGAELTSPQTFGGSLSVPARILGIRPTLDRPYAAVDVTAVLPQGNRVPLLRLRAPHPDWQRRYWLAEPVDLAQGTRIEVMVTPVRRDSDEQPPRPRRHALEVAVDFVSP